MVQWLKLCAPNAGGLGWIPGQGTNKVPHAATKTSCSQINKYLRKKKKGSQASKRSQTTECELVCVCLLMKQFKVKEGDIKRDALQQSEPL